MDDKTAFREAMEAELHHWEADLQQWEKEDEGTEGTAQLRREQQQMLDDLHEKRMRARQYLDQLARSDHNHSDWSDLKHKMETLWQEIRTQIDLIKSWAQP